VAGTLLSLSQESDVSSILLVRDLSSEARGGRLDEVKPVSDAVDPDGTRICGSGLCVLCMQSIDVSFRALSVVIDTEGII
jgi:hypothetical protein